MKETKGNQEEPIKIKREIKSGTNTKQLIHKYKSLKKLKRQITHLNLRGECIKLKKKKMRMLIGSEEMKRIVIYFLTLCK